jgi:hypothetical protein
MKIPDEITIGGFKFKIQMVDELFDDEDGELMGTCDYNNLTIKILSTLKKPQRESTYIHELLEAINFIFATKLTHRQIESLEGGLYQALK